MTDLASWLLEQISKDEDDLRSAHLLQYEEPTYVDLAARVLAECEAKRRIVELWQGDKPLAGRVGMVDDYYWYALADVLKLLAVPYADRPGFDETWRPDTEGSTA